jgi:pimeloyl-ACP methyl ester carboxylesterase
MTSDRGERRRRIAGWVAAAIAAAILAAVCAGAPRQATGQGESPRGAAQGFVNVGGARLYWEARGAGEPVVLIQGGNLDRRMWDAQMDTLARHVRVIRYDVRGFGRSGRADSAYMHHEDLRVLLDSLRVRRAHLVGLSLGGRIAVDLALEHPERVSSLVLAGPGLSGFAWSAPDSAWVGRMREALTARDSVRASLLWLESDYMRPAMERPALRARLRELTVANASMWVGPDAERELSPGAVTRLAELGGRRIPTLLIIGERDVPDIHRIVDTLAASIPGARRVVVAGAGHMVNMEEPARFNAEVLAFLRRR